MGNAGTEKSDYPPGLFFIAFKRFQFTVHLDDTVQMKNGKDIPTAGIGKLRKPSNFQAKG